MDYKRLLTVLEFKSTQNSCYYKVINEIEIKKQKLAIYKGAMLLNVNIPSGIENEIYLSILYENPENEQLITNRKEGIFLIDFQELTSLLIAGKIKAYYTNNNIEDKEIKKLIEEV